LNTTQHFPALLELNPESRSYRLREMFWQEAHRPYVESRKLAGCGEATLVGRAKDFATWLEASPPAIQPVDRLAGILPVWPAEGSSLDFGHYDGHYPPGHANLIRLGWTGIRDRAREKLAAETDPTKRDFLEAVALAYEAAIRFAEKHAAHAEALADQETDPTRQAELTRLAEVCRELTVGPPQSFQAGLQMVWFTFMFGGRGCLGRFDQWLDPLYQRDLEAGRLTPEEAQELVENLWIKLNYFAGNNDSLRNVILAGQTPTGEEASNDVTRMALLATGRLMLPEPKLNVRFFPGTPPEILELSARLTQKGLSQPAYFNDEVAIPALCRLGLPLEDARDYTNDGCSELIIGGKATISFHNFDTLPLLNETVRQAQTEPYASFADVLADFKERLTRFMPDDHGGRASVTHPYFAGSLSDCLESAAPDGVRYSLWGRIPSQMANVADGLAVIKKFIFEERSLTWDDLIAALDANYEGWETLRQKFLNRAPKYGNDDEEVDQIIKELAEYFCDELHARAGNEPGPGGKVAAGFMSFGLHGRRHLPASPDGRQQGDHVASSFSPALGADRHGPTAVLKSLSRVDLRKASHGSVLDIAFQTSALRGEANYQKFLAFVRTFLTLPCSATLQVNVMDRDTLLRARANPTDPAYRTLLVRVWGFSTVFVTLDPALQEHVLERTEHGW